MVVVKVVGVLSVAVLAASGLSVQSTQAAGPSVGMAADSDDVITFYYGLKRKEGKAKKRLIEVSDPDRVSYRNFVDRSLLAKRYGARKSAKQGLKRSARNAGLKFSLDTTGVFARVTGTVAKMQAWTGQQIISSTGVIADGVTVYAAQGDGLAPGTKKFVREAVPAYQEQTGVVSSSLPKNSGTWMDGCKAAKGTGAYSYAQLNKAYGQLAGPNNRKIGKRTTMAILASSDGYSDANLARAAKCFGTPGRTFNRVATDGVHSALPAGDEGDLDTQVAQAILPKGSTVYYLEGLPFVALTFVVWAKVLDLPALPQTASYSYGLCEPKQLDIVVKLVDSVLLRLGLAGVSAMASSGDDGSSDCGPATKKLAVDYPSSSPYMTSVGGSLIKLNSDNTRRTEVVWNQGERGGSGGGGQSILAKRPWWQAGNGSKMRTTPDISANAAPAPGWAVYTVDGQGGSSWKGVGGTSASSPFFASVMAVMAAKEAKQGRPAFGFLNPALYDMPESAIYDITRGNNELYNPKCCKATVGYDWASGLGAPNLKKMARAFAYYGIEGRG
ncbi:MAG: hypothetical protein K0U64_03015 [Actinomycetia bacterium]|nr:hypothetical protein [Actinomycetes bacterium]